MDIYIKGMEMPTIEMEWTIKCGADGKWYAIDTNAETTDGEWHEIIPIPPHRRLIDAGEIDYYEVERNGEKHYMVWKPHIDSLPTIIPAEGEEKT